MISVQRKGNELIIAHHRSFLFFGALVVLVLVTGFTVWMLTMVWTGDSRRGLSDLEFWLFTFGIVGSFGLVLYKFVLVRWHRNKDVLMRLLATGFEINGERFVYADLVDIVVIASPNRYGTPFFSIALELRERSLMFLGTGLDEANALQVRVELERFFSRTAVRRKQFISP